MEFGSNEILDWISLLIMGSIYVSKWIGGLVLFLLVLISLLLAQLSYAINSRWHHLKHSAVIQYEAMKKKKQGPTWDAQEILPGIWLGSFPAAVRREELQRRNITHILSIGAEFAPVFPEEFTYLVAFAVDSSGQDILRYFPPAIAFIDEALTTGSAVLVHWYRNYSTLNSFSSRFLTQFSNFSHAGVSRSAALVAAYLIAHGGHNSTQALNSIRKIRPCICPNSGFRLQLQSWELSLHHPHRANSIRRHALAQVVLGGCMARYEKSSTRPIFVIGNFFSDLCWRLGFQALVSYGNFIAKTAWGQEFISQII